MKTSIKKTFSVLIVGMIVTSTFVVFQNCAGSKSGTTTTTAAQNSTVTAQTSVLAIAAVSTSVNINSQVIFMPTGGSGSYSIYKIVSGSGSLTYNSSYATYNTPAVAETVTISVTDSAGNTASGSATVVVGSSSSSASSTTLYLTNAATNCSNNSGTHNGTFNNAIATSPYTSSYECSIGDNQACSVVMGAMVDGVRIVGRKTSFYYWDLTTGNYTIYDVCYSNPGNCDSRTQEWYYIFKRSDWSLVGAFGKRENCGDSPAGKNFVY